MRDSALPVGEDGEAIVEADDDPGPGNGGAQPQEHLITGSGLALTTRLAARLVLGQRLAVWVGNVASLCKRR